ncbi:hypothetical protein M3Y94_00002800 [Aphelenchoides besseyi]|nr:hypothetical protein M3Y94_00002800 [Aphelenchoides besseyi]
MKVLVLLLIALSVEGYRLHRIIRVAEFNHPSNHICTTAAPTESPFGQCASEVCGNYTASCSSNPKCNCFRTSDGKGICSLDTGCSRSCDDCPPEYGFCIVNTCCTSSCQPHSAADSCKEPPTAKSIRLAKLTTRKECKDDSECEDGKFCRQQSTGMFCANK